MRTITEPEMTAAILAAVDRMGTNHTVDRCVYADDSEGAPVCLIGTALDSMGVSVKNLGMYNTWSIVALLRDIPEVFDINVPGWLGEAVHRGQRHQDRGHSWGAAAREYLESVLTQYVLAEDDENIARVESLLLTVG